MKLFITGEYRLPCKGEIFLETRGFSRWKLWILHLRCWVIRRAKRIKLKQ